MPRFIPSRRERRLATPAFALALLSAGLGNGAFAQPAAIKSATLDPVVVTAARGPQPVADLVADVTVVDREEIARTKA